MGAVRQQGSVGGSLPAPQPHPAVPPVGIPAQPPPPRGEQRCPERRPFREKPAWLGFHGKAASCLRRSRRLFAEVGPPTTRRPCRASGTFGGAPLPSHLHTQARTQGSVQMHPPCLPALITRWLSTHRRVSTCGRGRGCRWSARGRLLTPSPPPGRSNDQAQGHTQGSGFFFTS